MWKFGRGAGSAMNAAVEVDEFYTFYEQHRLFVRRVASRLSPRDEVDDVVQECFFRLWKARGSFRDDAKITTWIYRVAINCAKDALERRSRHQRNDLASFESSQDETQAAPKASPSDSELVERILNGLASPYREVLSLVALEECSLGEVAEILEANPATVRTWLHRARQQAQVFLRNKENFQ